MGIVYGVEYSCTCAGCRFKMEELLKCGDFDGLASFCEQEELQAPGGVPNAQIYSTLLAVYLHQNELDHAKLLWQRIPSEVKDSSPELKDLWEIGKKLWKREFGAVYGLAQSPAWPAHLEPIVTSLVEQVRQRVTNLISKAYKTIKLSELCTLLGQSEEQVKQVTGDLGWVFDSQQNVIKPKLQKVVEGGVLKEHQERLERLTDIVSFLEN